MKLNRAKPYSVVKDADKADAERLAKRRALGEAFSFITGIGLAVWFYTSPETFKSTFTYLIGLLK